MSDMILLVVLPSQTVTLQEQKSLRGNSRLLWTFLQSLFTRVKLNMWFVAVCITCGCNRTGCNYLSFSLASGYLLD